MRMKVAFWLTSSILSLSNALKFQSTVKQFAECGTGIGTIYESVLSTIPNADIIHELLKSPNYYFNEIWKSSFGENEDYIKILLPLISYPKYHSTLFSGEVLLLNPILTEAFFGKGNENANSIAYTGNFLVKLRSGSSNYIVPDELLRPVLKYAIHNNLSQAESYELIELFINQDNNLLKPLLNGLSYKQHVTSTVILFSSSNIDDKNDFKSWIRRYLSENIPREQLLLRLVILSEACQSEVKEVVKKYFKRGNDSNLGRYLTDLIDKIETDPLTLFEEISAMKDIEAFEGTYTAALISISISALIFLEMYPEDQEDSAEKWQSIMQTIELYLFDSKYSSKLAPIEKSFIVSSIMGEIEVERDLWNKNLQTSFMQRVYKYLTLNCIPEIHWSMEEKVKTFKREANMIMINSAVQHYFPLPNFAVDTEVDELPTLPINLSVTSPFNYRDFLPYHWVLLNEVQTMLSLRYNFYQSKTHLTLSGKKEDYYKLAASWVYLLYHDQKMDLSALLAHLPHDSEWLDFEYSLFSPNDDFLSDEEETRPLTELFMDSLKHYGITEIFTLNEFRQLADSSFAPNLSFKLFEDDETLYHMQPTRISERSLSDSVPVELVQDEELRLWSSDETKTNSQSGDSFNSSDYDEDDFNSSKGIDEMHSPRYELRNQISPQPRASPQFNENYFIEELRAGEVKTVYTCKEKIPELNPHSDLEGWSSEELIIQPQLGDIQDDNLKDEYDDYEEEEKEKEKDENLYLKKRWKSIKD